MNFAGVSMENIKVLIADDSALARKKTKDCLFKHFDCEIFEASNGNDVIELYKQNQPDFVLLDIIMPEKTGLEALKEIIDINSKAKVIMLTSVGSQSYLKEAVELGAYNFLQKPLVEDQLISLLQHELKK